MSVPTEPAWIHQAGQLHAKLLKNAKENEYGQLIWEGKLLDLYHETGASNGNYSRIIKLLEANELIRFVQRGNRFQSTQIEVARSAGELQLIAPEHLTEPRHAATLVAAMEERVQSLTTWRESLEKGGLDVAKVLQDFELRLTRIERELLLNAKSKKQKQK